MLKSTPLFKQHQLAGAKLVDFFGWQMPLHYGSQLQEHHAVRKDVGMFDVSHMAIVDVMGQKANDYLRYLLANDVDKLKASGKALYSCMLNPKGGVIDDLIVYRFTDTHYRLVLNAGTRDKDWFWLQTQSNSFACELKQRDDLAILAIQGPNAIQKILSLVPMSAQGQLLALKPFESVLIGDIFYCRTGYTGEDGLEIQIPSHQVEAYWEKCLALGIKPCGLGARDTLRLEAGLNLYGIDMDESTTPLESNLSWTVAFDPIDRDFIGRQALETQRQEKHKKLVGLVLESGGVLRNHQKIVLENQVAAEITSGTFSPTLGHAIALARLPLELNVTSCQVEMRQGRVTVEIVQPPFVRKGKKVYSVDHS
jgi:aminomethyltransferase